MRQRQSEKAIAPPGRKQGRQADSAGLTFWTGQLRAGRTRGEIMLQFSNSDECIAKLRQG